ncbi:2Fe-2S ferredoxin-type domain-containing protein [Tuber brumale]|nr:2Fe-2S ferredoxin-type domain-containing protein [Tuber brumale]
MPHLCIHSTNYTTIPPSPQIMFPRAIITPTSRLLLRQPHSHLPRRTSPPPLPILPSILTRPFSTTLLRKHGHTTPPKPGEELYVTFIDKSSSPHKFAVSAGENLLDIAQEHDLDMEGACGGSAACSTCHVIVVDDAMYERIPEPEDDENDMLDLAFGLTETSRLGCQVKMSKEIDGLVVKLPSMTRNLQSSDFSKKE